MTFKRVRFRRGSTGFTGVHPEELSQEITEREFRQLMKAGASDTEIAEKTGLSLTTVEQLRPHFEGKSPAKSSDNATEYTPFIVD
ncbi:MAG TPA: response regulator transcription factor [Firmicutes bacterium]|nr:response regulator transcription factor [Bacillota bacterium]